MKKWRKKHEKQNIELRRIDCVRYMLQHTDIVDYEKYIGSRENLNLNLFK